jgi:hypothetical protein
MVSPIFLGVVCMQIKGLASSASGRITHLRVWTRRVAGSSPPFSTPADVTVNQGHVWLAVMMVLEGGSWTKRRGGTGEERVAAQYQEEG